MGRDVLVPGRGRDPRVFTWLLRVRRTGDRLVPQYLCAKVRSRLEPTAAALIAELEGGIEFVSVTIDDIEYTDGVVFVRFDPLAGIRTVQRSFDL